MKIHSVRFKITAITVSAILIAILAIFAASSPSVQEETDRRSVEVMRLIGGDARNTLDAYFEGIEQSVGIAANMAIDSLDSMTLVECGAAGNYATQVARTPEQTARLDAYIAEHCAQIQRVFESVASHTNGVIMYYYCINPEISETVHGFFYSRVGKAGFVEQPPLDARTLDPADSEHTTWYYTPIRRGVPGWVGPYTAHFPEEMRICSYLVPIYSTGKLIGIMGMDIPLKTLADQVSPIRVYKTGFVSLCDQDGRIIYHPELAEGVVPELSDISVSRDLLARENSGNTLIRYTTHGEQRQMSFSTLKNGMKLVITAPVREINAEWTRLIRVVVLITITAVILSAIIMMLAMRLITLPLLRLTAASQRLANADYDVALNYHVNDEIGMLTSAFIKMRDQLKKYIEDLNRRINTDTLTGLPNMRCFFRLATSERRRLIESGKAPVMLYFDLIGTKHYNRQHGFEEGDRLLCDVGQILARHYGENALCRFSEDHFAVVTSEEGMAETLEEIFEECKGANNGNSLPLRVGIYQDSMEAVSVSVACDRAKYACDKHRGSFVSGYYLFDSEMLSQLDGVRYIISHLDEALEGRWIEVYYQPIIRAITGRVCDEEALSRWVDPVRGMLSPGVFIPILEKARLIYKLDLYVLDQILEKMCEQKKDGLQIVPHSLNLSRADFDACDIVEEIRRRVDAAGIARDRLTIEITESIIGQDFDFMKEQIERFQALGFQVWMDDFGSGYSSLDVLQDIHFDLLKFDMRFMKRFGENAESKVILTDLVRMAIDLGIDTVCEGVETREEVEFLREIGCSKLQGYYYCKPIPYREILERNRLGIQIGYENPAESDYFTAIGRVNLNDLTVISEQEVAHQDYYDRMPVGIMQVRAKQICFVRSNPSYRAFMKKYFNFDISSKECGYPVDPPEPASSFMKLARQCCADGNRMFFDGKLSDGSAVHVIINRVGMNPVTNATAVSIVVLSITEPGESTTYADIARALAADYYNIYVVDLDTERFIEYSSRIGGEELAMERHGADFFASARRDTMTRIYDEDREPFLSLFTKENIIKELNEQGVFTTTYRLIDTGTPMYVNMKITRMPGGNRIIMGISIVDSQMRQKEHFDELQRGRDTLVRVMALSDGYLSIFTVDPVSGRYLEYSSSEDYNTLGAAKEGKDFFRQARIDAQKYLYPEDAPLFAKYFTRENILREIRENGSFRIDYRLMLGGEPKPVTLRIAPFKDGDEEKLVVGLRAWKERKSPM